MATLLRTTNRPLCVSWHLKANELLKHTWEPPTDNYAGEPLYNGNKEIIGIRPMFDGEYYVFPLMENQALFLENDVISSEELETYGVS